MLIMPILCLLDNMTLCRIVNKLNSNSLRIVYYLCTLHNYTWAYIRDTYQYKSTQLYMTLYVKNINNKVIRVLFFSRISYFYFHLIFTVIFSF